MTDTLPGSPSDTSQRGPIRTLLIANRGEIACRIIRTARRLGIKTVAVYSDTDRLALHVEQADVAYPLGGHSAADSYLNADALINAALKTGSDAMHPGYGFLSENADFAQLCTTNGLRFVGPTAESIRSMGSKSAAKSLMESSGVPLLPGYHGTEQGIEFLKKTAATIGYPIMLKASAGGGGKGMRIVRSSVEFPEALNAVKRESLASFGSDQVLIERYVEKPRHIEIQVFGDTWGNHVHLFERDCSIQRRHQKVLEEAPAPHMTAQWREQMGSAAIAAAKSINYVGAGTVEFIVDQEQQFYFMEMNTRLQVEHPITEMVTGVDLVEWQLHVAAGEPLPCTQQELSLTGHSIEARLYAEDTEKEFLPSTGTLSLLEFPANSDTLRIEAGVCQGSEISVYYDPMMAKIISYGADRKSAINTLINALESTHILGVANNASYLCRVLSTPAFRQAQLSTTFLEDHATLINPAPEDDGCSVDGVLSKATAAALAAIFISLEQVRPDLSAKAGALCADGWRLNTAATTTIALATVDASSVYTIKLNQTGTTFTANCNVQQLTFRNVSARGNTVLAELDERLMQARILNVAREVSVICDHREHRFTIANNSDLGSARALSQQSMLSPMPGKVIQVLVKEGDEVELNQPVMIIEAMKMEHTIRANQSGVVETIYFRQHNSVDANAQLLVIRD